MLQQNKNSFIYELKDTLEYPHGGELLTAKYLEFYAPSLKMKGTSAQISSLYINAVFKVKDMFIDNDAVEKSISNNIAPDPEDEEKDRQKKSRAYYTMFISGIGKNITQAFDMFDSLLQNNCCKVDGEHTVNAGTLKGLSVRDYENAFSEYLLAFLDQGAF